MEYEFRHDTITGSASAIFSYEHQIFGPWLEVEVGKDSDKLSQLLSALDTVSSGKEQEMTITGHEYTLVVSGNDVTVSANGVMNNDNVVPEHLALDELTIDESGSASCGIEDFRACLFSWAHFIKK
ncbi:YacL family protein [Thalassotalea piscium]